MNNTGLFQITANVIVQEKEGSPHIRLFVCHSTPFVVWDEDNLQLSLEREAGTLSTYYSVIDFEIKDIFGNTVKKYAKGGLVA